MIVIRAKRPPRPDSSGPIRSPAVADPVALQAERLLHVLEDLPAAPRVPRTGQCHLDEPLVVEARTPAAEPQVEFGRARGGGDLDGQAVGPPTEVDLDAVGIRLERLDLGSLVDELAVRPDAERAVAGRQELHGRRLGAA